LFLTRKQLGFFPNPTILLSNSEPPIKKQTKYRKIGTK